MTRNEASGDFPFIGAPALSALEHAGYTKLEDLTHVPESELANLHGMGPKALGILRAALSERGQAFAPEPFPKISAPARRALENAGYTRLEDLTQASGTDVANLHGMGPKAFVALREALNERGLAFADES